MKGHKKKTQVGGIKMKKSGIFIGGAIDLELSKPEYVIYGYIKPENGYYVAVCVNMCLVAQGSTADNAFKKLVDSAQSYIQYLKDQFPKKWKSKIEHDSPSEFKAEFYKMLMGLKPLLQAIPMDTRKRKAVIPQEMPTIKPNISPGSIFVQPISASYA